MARGVVGGWDGGGLWGFGRIGRIVGELVGDDGTVGGGVRSSMSFSASSSPSRVSRSEDGEWMKDGFSFHW